MTRVREVLWVGKGWRRYLGCIESVRAGLVVGLLLVASVCNAGVVPTTTYLETKGKHRCGADWMYRGQLGLSTHFFASRPSERTLVDRFDVKRVAAQAVDAGAAWFLLPIHHQPWVMSAPNSTYDAILGSSDYTSRRDLPSEFSDALAAKGIRLMLYVNLRVDPASACPIRVRTAMGGWPPNDRLIQNIAAVYREFSVRYGKRIAGWWVDGAGIQEYALAPQRERWFAEIADALRAGNPEAVVAFNPGVRVASYSEQDDYTAGEMNGLNVMPNGRWLDGVQWHAWTFLGGWWASDGIRFDDEELGRYVGAVTGVGGAVTLEVGTRGVQVHGRGGRVERRGNVGYIDPAQIAQLQRLRDVRRNGRHDSDECKAR